MIALPTSLGDLRRGHRSARSAAGRWRERHGRRTNLFVRVGPEKENALSRFRPCLRSRVMRKFLQRKLLILSRHPKGKAVTSDATSGLNLSLISSTVRTSTETPNSSSTACWKSTMWNNVVTSGVGSTSRSRSLSSRSWPRATDPKRGRRAMRAERPWPIWLGDAFEVRSKV